MKPGLLVTAHAEVFRSTSVARSIMAAQTEEVGIASIHAAAGL